MGQDIEAHYRAVANRFFNAIEAGDIATMYDTLAPGCPVWHNYDEQTITPEYTAKVLASMHAAVTNPRYTNRKFFVVRGGFVQQHILEATRKDDGTKVRLPAMLICKVEGDKIATLEEYFDSAQQLTFHMILPKL